MTSSTVLRWTIGISVIVAIYQAAIFHLGLQASADFEKVWGFVFTCMLAFWVDTDSKNRAEVYRPSFDFGLFIYLVWLIYLPYYLLRTRGRKGWFWIVGLFVLASLGTILQWLTYAVT
jgi:hypothetical protein